MPQTLLNKKKPGQSIAETKVQLTIEYPSKFVWKELTGNDDCAVLGKAIVCGSKQQITKVVLKNIRLKKIVVAKELQLITMQLNGICSRKQPSMLTANTKEKNVNIVSRKCVLKGKK